MINFCFHQTGNEIVEPGRQCGRGLTENAAKEMGLIVGTPVATSLIDAHAGGLGMIGVGLKDPENFKNRLGKLKFNILLFNDIFQILIHSKSLILYIIK